MQCCIVVTSNKISKGVKNLVIADDAQFYFAGLCINKRRLFIIIYTNQALLFVVIPDC